MLEKMRKDNVDARYIMQRYGIRKKQTFVEIKNTMFN